MKTVRRLTLLTVSCALMLLFAACASHNPDARITNPRQPGPIVGNAVGVAAGAVAGNVAGAVVGIGEGFVSQAGEAFNTDRRVVRQWVTVRTVDGREVQVPVDIEVDANGVPLGTRGTIITTGTATTSGTSR
jgi:hypothetical protein